jgi:Domain of unknown function (DUF4265)
VSDPGREFVVHEEPIWRDRADFVIHAALRESDSPRRFEQLWARQLAENEFEVCCIPFFLYDVALGDVVRTAPHDDQRYVVDSVIRPAGRFVFRVWFGESFQPREPIIAELHGLGALTERSSVNLLAVDAADDEQAQRVANYLATSERRGDLRYETGRS